MRIEKFTNLYRDVTKEGTKIPQEKYCLTGQFPIVDQGQRVIAGWWNDDAGIFKNVPAIIFGDHTRAIKYMEQPFFIGADGVKILRPTNIKDNPKYLYYALQAAKIPNLGYSRHFKVVKELQICIYSRDEQNEIVRVLEKIDYLIEQRHAETTYLDQLVKSRFIELFGEPELNPRDLPVLPWGAVFQTTTGKLDSNAMVENGRYPFFTCAKESYKIDSYAFDCEALLLAGNNAAGIYDVKHYKGKFNAYQRTYVLRLMNEKWSYILFKRQLEDKLRYLQSQSKGTNTRYLTLGILNELRFVVPPIAEQEQFAAFVEQTDKSKYYSSLSFRYCQAAANTYRQEWMTCRTSDF